MISPLFSAVLCTAWAQVDTSGPAPLPLAEGAAAPLRIAPAQTPLAGAWSLALGIRGAGPSLTEFQFEGEQLIGQTEVVGVAVDVALGGSYAITDRVVASAAVPVRLGAGGSAGGTALSDPRLSVGLGLVQGPSADDLALRLTPWVRVPVGSTGRQVSPGGVRAGANIGVGLGLGPVAMSTDLGAELQPEAGLPGGPGWRWGLGAAVPIDERISVGVEVASWGLFAAKGRGVGNETTLNLRGRFGRAWVAGYGGPALWVREPGTPSASGGLVAGFSGGPQRGPGVVLSPQILVQVSDAAGRPVRGATLQQKGEPIAITGADGSARVSRGSWSAGISVEASGLVASALPAAAPKERADIQLDFAPVPVRVRVTDPLGNPLQVSTTLQRVDEPATEDLVQSGRFLLGEVVPGTWMLSIEADGKGSQQRLLEVGRRRERPVYIEVILLDKSGEGTLAVEVVDAADHKVEGARIQVDGVPVGTTAPSGRVWVHDLEGESRSVTVRSEDYADAVVDVALNQGDEAVQQVSMDYVPGTVRIRAEGPNGPVSDAILLISGPSALPPMPLGEDGERLVVLDPGRWTISLSSVALGVQERGVEITPESPNPLLAEFILLPDLGGEVDLVVRVQDRNGIPLDGAMVAIDGESVGHTASGGNLRLRGIPAGTHEISVEHEAIVPVTGELEATEGIEEHLVNVRWRSGVMRVTASAAGLPADALVLFDGPAERDPAPLGDRGQRYFDGLPNGLWEVTASSAEYGIQTRRVSLSDPTDELPEALIRYGGLEGGSNKLIVQVKGPDGQPLAGAPVSLDGLPVGTTGSDGSVELAELAGGTRRVRACDAPYMEVMESVRLRGEQTRLDVSCGWAVGAIRFRVSFKGLPAEGTLLLLSGPSTRPPVAVDSHGEQLLTLEPGDWGVTLSHPAAGLVEFPFTIPDLPTLTTLDTDLDGDLSPSLLLRVRTPAGKPIPGARVRVGEEEPVLSNAAGLAVLRSLQEGAEVRFEIDADGYAPDVPHRIEIRGLRTEKVIELAPLPSELEISVVSGSGEPIDARIDLVGDQRLPTLEASGGPLHTEVSPGMWQVFARADGWATQRATVEVERGVTQLEMVLEPAQVRRVGNDLQVPSIRFEVGRTEVREGYGALLEEIAAQILADPSIVRVEAQGHTDDRGGVAMNMELSQRRAEEVRYALIDLGVPQSRVVARGFGPTHPNASNADEAGRSKNRRVAFVIVENVPVD